MKKNGDGLFPRDLGDDSIDPVRGKKTVRPFLLRNSSVDNEELNFFVFSSAEAVTEAGIRLGNEKTVGAEGEGFTHHRDIIVIACGIIERDLKPGEHFSGETIRLGIGIINNVSGVNDEIGRKRQGIDRCDERDGVVVGIRPADRFETVRAEMGIADVDDFQHG